MKFGEPDENGVISASAKNNKEFIEHKNEAVALMVEELETIIENTEEGRIPLFIEEINATEEFLKYTELMTANHYNALNETDKKIKEQKIMLNMHMWNEWMKWTLINKIKKDGRR